MTKNNLIKQNISKEELLIVKTKLRLNYTEPLLVFGLLRKLSNQNCQPIGLYKAIMKFRFTIFNTGLV
jgi:hypothetical protein